MAYSDRYNYLTSMLNGCKELIKNLVSFEDEMDTFIFGSEPYTADNENAVIEQYKRVYGLRSSIYSQVNDYLNLYSSELTANYGAALTILNTINQQFLIISNYKTLDSYVTKNSMWLILGRPSSYVDFFPTQRFEKALSVSLRDPLLSAINSLSNTSTSQSTSGSVTAPASIETTNAEATQLLNAAQIRIKDPVVQSWINKDFTTKDIHDQAVVRVSDKNKEATIEMQILKKLGDSAFMASIDKSTQGVQNFLKGVYNGPGIVGDYMSTWAAKYIFKNLMYNQIRIADPNDPQGAQLKSVMRERTRRKYPAGMLFCDEEIVNGNIVLKKDAESQKQLDAARKGILNKMLNSKQ